MSRKRVYNLIAFIAVFCTAISIMLGYLLGRSDTSQAAANICNKIAFICATIVTIIGAFYYARSKRRIIWMILFVIAVVIIIIFTILPLFNI